MSLSAEEYKKLIAFLSSKELKNKTKITAGFSNFMHTQEHPEALVVKVESKEALSALLCEIQALNRNKESGGRIILRVAAGGRTNATHSASYSATPVTDADIIIQLTGREFTKITREANTNIVRAGASLQIGELDRSLYEFHGLALPSSSLIPYVTVAGLSAAGGHGTGKDQPSFAGLIRGATFMLENGKEVHITNDHPDFATIMGANNGLFGIVMDVDIECTPRKKMECVMEKRSVAEFMDEVERGLFQHDPYVSAMYMPTYLPDEMTNQKIKNVIVYRWRPVPLETHNTNFNPLLSDFSQDVQTALGNAVNIPEILRAYPGIIPFYMRHITSRLAIGHTDELSVGSWPEMMHYRTSFPTDLDEICGIFPVKDQPENKTQGKEIVTALKKAITLLGEHAKRGEYPITYGLYFRFIQGTNGGLSFTSHPEGHHVCAMDLTTNRNVRGFAQFEKSMQDFFINEMNAKFHWGKNAPMDLDYNKLYGKDLDATKTALEKWHHTHHISLKNSALLNPLFSKVFGYPIPQLTTANRTAVVERSAMLEPGELTPVSKRRQTAVYASKLVNVMSDQSAECETIKEQIEADIQKRKLSSQSLFATPPTTPKLTQKTPTTPRTASNPSYKA